MAMKSTTVRGTPMRSIHAGGEGRLAGKPAGFNGTVNKQFEGDQKGNREEGISTGTPYHSQNGNAATTKNVKSHDRYGMVRDENGDQNNPRDNGDGVILDKITRDGDYLPKDEGTMDSPVPHGAPALAKGEVRRENTAHLGVGKGAAPAQAHDEILKIGGVLSRGMDEDGMSGDDKG